MFAQTKNTQYWVVAGLLILSFLLGACSPPAPPVTQTQEPPTQEPAQVPVRFDNIEPAELTGATWQWVGGRESVSMSPMTVPNPENYTLTFNEDGTLFVQADCNTSRATYEISGDQLGIMLGATTLMACPPGSLSDQFLDQLGNAAGIGSGFGNLVIVLADGTGEMYFQRGPAAGLGADLEPITQDDLVDTLWQWTNLVETTSSVETGIGNPENYDLVFRADGTYSARADCNRLNGTYVMDGSQLTINPGITSLAACEPDSRYDQYASLLFRVTGVGTQEGLLVLLVEDGAAAMSFVNAGESPVVTAPPVIEGDPATFLGTPDGVENFDNANNWTEFSNACFTTQVSGGQFSMTANGLSQSPCWEFSWPRLDNFYLETTLQMPETCDPQDRFGVIFRAPDTNRGYLYGYNCAGQYTLTIWDGEATTVLVEPAQSNEILNTPGAVNRMGLLAFQENISLFANGVYLQTVTDFTYLDEGRVGYFVRAATEDPFTVRYDQVRIWNLEDEFYLPDVPQPLPPIDIPEPPSNAPSGEARVNVNVRTGPSVLFPILGTAQQGDTGEIQGISPDGSWYAVTVPTTRVGTGTAWVSADFVNLTNPTGQPLPVVTPPLLPGLVTFPTPPQTAPQITMREAATLRSGPALEFPVFGVAPTGSNAEVLGESSDGEWWAVRLPASFSSDGNGWVLKAFARASNLPANVPVIRTPQLPRNINPAAPGSGAPSLVTREPLNVRTGPGNAYPSLGQVGIGTVMAVVGVSPDRESYVVNIPTEIDRSGRGWVAARFVRTQNVGNVPVVQPPPVP